MAATYNTTGSRASVKVLDEGTVIDVEAIGIVTKPTGIRFTVPVPMAAFRLGEAHTILNFAATEVEALVSANPDAGQHLITGGSGNQQVDQNGLIAYFITFVVSYTPGTPEQGTFETTVTLPVALFESAAAYDAGIGGKSAVQLVLEAYDRVKALALS